MAAAFIAIQTMAASMTSASASRQTARRMSRPAGDVAGRIGLVLTGGGARGAYQAGVLRGIAEILGRGSPNPFAVLTGVSAGAINATALAAGSDDFWAATSALHDTWHELRVDQVFRTDACSIAPIAARWMRDLALGGLLGETSSNHLLDTSPLRKLLASRIDFSRIRDHLANGAIHGLAVSATNYGSGAAVTFFDGSQTIMPWRRETRIARRATIDVRHVMASAAIPMFFPPERIANSFYGDGCVRLTAPLSPAVHLGAERVLAIGVRHSPAPAVAALRSDRGLADLGAIDVAGVLLNAVFLDSLEADIERMQRINRTLGLLAPEGRAAHPDGLRPIELFTIKPSRDLGMLAAQELTQLPATLEYMLRGLGASGGKGWDVLSYLAFDAAYTRILLDLGLADARAHEGAIRAFVAPAALAAKGD
jgi:NTE family protein